MCGNARWPWVLLCLAVAVASGAAQDKPLKPPEAPLQVKGPETQPDGLLLCRVASPYQQGETLVRFLVPKVLEPPEKRRILFVLPVEPGVRTRWGDPVRAARAAEAADRFGFVVVLPTFSTWPWYCDHPTKRDLRQESYVLEVLVPLVARLYPHEAKRRALLGFSKSGWGAFSLLLRHPDAFGAAAAWDAPMMMNRPEFGMGSVVGTLEQFEKYRIERLLRERAEGVRGAKRLALSGYGNFREDTRGAHALMDELNIPHEYADGPFHKHHWESGWLEEAVRAVGDMIR